jgi:hypothetical protein
LVRIHLASQNYKPLLWSPRTLKFEEVPFDILEQKHYSLDGSEITDFDMYIPA